MKYYELGDTSETFLQVRGNELACTSISQYLRIFSGGKKGRQSNFDGLFVCNK